MIILDILEGISYGVAQVSKEEALKMMREIKSYKSSGKADICAVADVIKFEKEEKIW